MTMVGLDYQESSDYKQQIGTLADELSVGEFEGIG
jgi:hypothetical protein